MGARVQLDLLGEGSREQQGRQQDGQTVSPAADASPPSRLAADYDEEMQAYFMAAPSGLGALAENQIRAGIKAGALENLKGKGKPLAQEDHSAQFYRVDPLIQAMGRTMGAQNMRPESVDRRDALLYQLAAFRRHVAAEVAKAKQQEKPQPVLAVGQSSEGLEVEDSTTAAVSALGSSNSGAASNSARSTSSSLWSQLLQLVSAGSGSPRTDSQQPAAGPGQGAWTLRDLRAGQHEGLKLALDEVNGLVKQYNSAVLQDKETYGAHWPLEQHPQLSMATEVDRAAAEQQAGG
ncbi:hypothetical protein N2152v2_006859 [Parachlorella kessleri]